VEYVPETEHLRAFDHDGKSLIDEQVLPEKLADHLGKDVAEKLLHDPSEVYDSGSGKKVHALNNVDLKVGGEGMAGFYDKMLPAAVNKLVKKYGAKVGEGDIRGHQYKGYESFGAGEGPTGSPAIFGIDKNGKWTLVRQNFKSGDEAIKEAEYLNSGGKSQNVHTLDITPALRKGATEEGFPQFASGGQVKPRQSRLTPVAHNPFEVQNAIRRAIHANRSA
jgi:hypothetical protein